MTGDRGTEETSAHEGRTYVVSGSASGMGMATKAYLEGSGAQVIGIDIANADVTVDLGTAAGRGDLFDGVQAMSGGRLDAIVACAGVRGVLPGQKGGSSPGAIVSVNYFGTVATLQTLRPLLEASDEPRAVAVGSVAMLGEHDLRLREACLEGNEEMAVELAIEVGSRESYRASKRALAQWIRREAPTSTWAGQGITLNAIAPAIVDTPMVADLTEELRSSSLEDLPLGLVPTADDISSLLAWLAGSENRVVTGQVIFIDGGRDTVARDADIWSLEAS